MKVAVDARTLQDHPLGGVGRALANVLPLIARDVEVELLTDARRPPPPSALPQHRVHGVGRRGVTWLQVGARRWLRGFDGVFHCPFYGLPFGLRVPGVATIHDLTFEHHPEWFPRSKLTTFRLQARHAAKVAGSIITVSEHVKADIVATYRVDPERIAVARNGVDPIFSPDRRDPARTAALGLDRPYVVCLAGAARRNHGTAIAAWRHLRTAGHDVQLAVVGGSTTPAEAGLVALAPLPDDDWAAVLAGATVLCYPTAYEGFGMPALEACASGTPVVAARVGSLPEVLGPAGVWCDNLTPESVADALAVVFAEEGTSRRTAVQAWAAAAPGWTDCAAAHLRAYSDAAHG